MEPLGFIMAISLSFRKPEDPFVSIDFTLQDLIRFFGDDFARAAGYQKFKSRRLINLMCRESRQQDQIPRGNQKDICSLHWQEAIREASGSWQK